MDELQPLSLKFKQPDRSPDVYRSLRWTGIVCEHTRVANPSQYEYSYVGPTHFLTLHDMVLSDSEMFVDGLKPIHPGDIRNKLAYLPPECSVSGWSAQAARANSFTTLYFDPATIAEETESLYRNGDYAPLVYFDDPALRSTLIKLQDIVTDETADNGLYAETLGLLAAVELHRLQSRGVPRALRGRTGGLSAAQEKLVREYIEDQLGEELRLDDLAAVARLSRFHFARAFKTSLGEPPHRYVMMRRLEKAKEMLARSPLPINDIATATGFRSASQFNRAFRDFVGVTPSAFRRNAINP